MNICYCIERLVPSASFQKMPWTNGQFPQLTEEMYEGLIWEDERHKPTWIQIKLEWIEVCKETLYKLIDNERDIHLAKGVQYLFPGDVIGIIQTKHLEDQRNIQINHASALTLLTMGLTEQPMYFRDMENRIHTLIPQEMVSMTMYVGSFGQHIYNNSWQHKDYIKSIEVSNITDEIEIDETIDYLLTYDYSQGWDL